MRRLPSVPRPGFRARLESQGFIYHTNGDGSPYWNEEAHYELESSEIDELERATNAIYALALEAGQHAIDRNLLLRLGIPPRAESLIRRAWDAEPPSIYCRLDLAYDGRGPPKLLELNADTPTALLEAAVAQWTWLEDTHAGRDQFNSIHERLLAKWGELRGFLRGPVLHFAAAGGSWEDEMTCAYLADCASQTGIQTRFLEIDRLGWDSRAQCFVDLEEMPVTDLFKLYPWEWLLAEPFGVHVPDVESTMTWIEPIWRMLWNKGLLALLWELNPDHPNLLPASLDGPPSADHVRKPLFSREGAGITLVAHGRTIQQPGAAGAEGFVYQEYVELPTFEGQHPVIGSWLIDGQAAGIGIRESSALITTGESRFVPHVIR
jgi:glutathionylspermidine synthase